MQRIWNDYFENFNKAVHMCDFDGAQRGVEPIRITEVEIRQRKLKNGKAAGKDEITGEIIKGGIEMVNGS